MKKQFLPNEKESQLIKIVQEHCRKEFALIRLTQTMMEKSIIDASIDFRKIFLINQAMDYVALKQGLKYYYPSVVIGMKIMQCKTSMYRPNSGTGDPRFWVYGFKKYASPGNLVYFTVYENRLIVIPLIDYDAFEENIETLFGNTDNEASVINNFKVKINKIVSSGWIESVSPNKLNDKDVGETLERELGVKINNLKSPDFEGKIEIKGKTLQSKTKDTLFSMVPDWKNSKIKSANEMALTYGYDDREYEGYKALFVTVSNTPNAQGLYLKVDEENEKIYQMHKNSDFGCEDTIICSWKFNEIEKRLKNKHPKTMWVIADRKAIKNKIHFKFLKVQYSKNPIFSQFLLLISQGLITYDWRRRAKLNLKVNTNLPSSKIDYGHGFRMDPKKRSLLFGEVVDFELFK